mmetsp:Transcript_27046/g.59387  ORF Transcript_27046/g.59387 Transcript_27046/m.59387 type:complete len:258 (+) Transcript_27046:105-878(+)
MVSSKDRVGLGSSSLASRARRATSSSRLICSSDSLMFFSFSRRLVSLSYTTPLRYGANSTASVSMTSSGGSAVSQGGFSGRLVGAFKAAVSKRTTARSSRTISSSRARSIAFSKLVAPAFFRAEDSSFSTAGFAKASARSIACCFASTFASLASASRYSSSVMLIDIKKAGSILTFRLAFGASRESNTNDSVTIETFPSSTTAFLTSGDGRMCFSAGGSAGGHWTACCSVPAGSSFGFRHAIWCSSGLRMRLVLMSG